MANSADVARYLIKISNDEDEGSISNLKLQKLMYYAQGLSLALFDRPLFDGNIEAWTHGPVHVETYHRYKGYRSQPLPSEDFDLQAINDQEKELLDEVFDVFGQFSAWKLRDMTHEEQPWLECEETASVIPHDTLKAYFKTRIVDNGQKEAHC